MELAELIEQLVRPKSAERPKAVETANDANTKSPKKSHIYVMPPEHGSITSKLAIKVDAKPSAVVQDFEADRCELQMLG